MIVSKFGINGLIGLPSHVGLRLICPGIYMLAGVGADVIQSSALMMIKHQQDLYHPLNLTSTMN